MKIKNISKEEANAIIETRKPLGKFIVVEEEHIVAIDNEDGNAWCEDFKLNERDLAERYLKGDYEVNHEGIMVEKPFKKNPEEYKCIAEGYIKLTDFVLKYFPDLSEKQKVNKHDSLRKVILRTPKHIKAKAGNARYILEKEFCLWVHVDYIEE